MRNEKVFNSSKIRSGLFQVMCIAIGIFLMLPLIYAVIISFTPQDAMVFR